MRCGVAPPCCSGVQYSPLPSSCPRDSILIDPLPIHPSSTPSPQVIVCENGATLTNCVASDPLPASQQAGAIVAYDGLLYIPLYNRNSVYICTYNSTALGSCFESDGGGVFANGGPFDVAFYGGKAYVLLTRVLAVAVCTNTANLTGCTLRTPSPALSNPTSLAIENGVAYIVNYPNPPKSLQVCDDITTFAGCTKYVNNVADGTFTYAWQVRVRLSVAYVADLTSPFTKVRVCPNVPYSLPGANLTQVCSTVQFEYGTSPYHVAFND